MPASHQTNGTVNIVGNKTRFNQLNSGDVLTIGPDRRRGIVLSHDEGVSDRRLAAPVGVTQIVIPQRPIASTGVDEFNRNDFVLLRHAPAWGQPKNLGAFYDGVYQITARPVRFRAHPPAPGPGTVTISRVYALTRAAPQQTATLESIGCLCLYNFVTSIQHLLFDVASVDIYAWTLFTG